MSETKERIIGAISIMNEQQAERVWALIQSTFRLTNAEEAEPSNEELQAMIAYHNGEADYRPVYTQKDVMIELGL